MQLASDMLMLGIFVGCLVWLSLLTFLLVRMISHYNRLGEGSNKAGLQEILQEILHTQQGLTKKSIELEKVARALAVQGQRHIQRIGIVRFNPFADTGGAQSFTIALLDGQDNGIIMTSLFARAGNRWYIKDIVGGKGREHELSKEELEAIRSATHGGAEAGSKAGSK